jgi:hypothetical protein
MLRRLFSAVNAKPYNICGGLIPTQLLGQASQTFAAAFLPRKGTCIRNICSGKRQTQNSGRCFCGCPFQNSPPTMPKKPLDSAFFCHIQRFTSAVYSGAVKSIDNA